MSTDGAPAEGGDVKTPSDITTSASAVERRVRAALDRSEAPSAADLAALLDELAQARTEAEERWQAITRLAPAAKRNRMRAHSAARERTRLASHLDGLDAILAGAPAGFADALRAWSAEARAILTDTDSGSS